MNCSQSPRFSRVNTSRFSYFDIFPLLILCLLFFGATSACNGNINEEIPSIESPQTPTSEVTFPVATKISPKQTQIDETPDSAIETRKTPGLDPTPSVSIIPSPVNVTMFPDPDRYMWEIIADGLNKPVALTSAQDGTGRLFAVEQGGLVKVIQEGEILPQPFMDLRGRLATTGGVSRGLLGLAFHPEFSNNRQLYVHYTNLAGNTIIAQFTAVYSGEVVDLDSELILLEISYPVGEHIGGDLSFGPDGYLYISIGDGGGPGYGDQDNSAQDPDSLLGKILRIDVNETGEQEVAYQIPQDNPYSSGGGRPEVWALGLRNPWRFSFDSHTGALFIGDVGENMVEEIDYLPAGNPGGANLGWNYREGSRVYRNQSPKDLQFTEPIIEYDHSQGCSVTGGAVYRGPALPEWSGIYLYGDYCQGKVWGLLQTENGAWSGELLYKLGAYIVSFGLDEMGEIYLVDIAGKIYQLVKK